MGAHPGCPVCLIVAASLVAVETNVGETISACVNDNAGEREMSLHFVHVVADTYDRDTHPHPVCFGDITRLPVLTTLPEKGR